MTRISLTYQQVELDLELYPASGTPRTVGPAALVLPGGGFREHTPHDGEAYGRWLAGLGVSAVVLRYRLNPDAFPLALQQARAALAALQHGKVFDDVDPERVGIIGSSAGGLLAGLVATGAVLSNEHQPMSSPRPAFHVQCYGLADLALLPSAAVGGLLGEETHLARELSPATHVDKFTPPTFVWATAQDGPGLPNALEWARVLAANQVSTELHIYPDGRHGVGLADGVVYGKYGDSYLPHTAQWTLDCARWLRYLEILAPIVPQPDPSRSQQKDPQ